MAEVQAPTKHQAFKIMFRQYFPIKVKCVSTFWSVFFCNNIFFWLAKTSFPTADNYFDPCCGLSFDSQGNLNLTFFNF